MANLRDQLTRMARMSNLGLSGQVPLTSDHFANYKQPPTVTFTGTKSSSQHRIPASQELEQIYKFQNLMGDLGDMVEDSGQLAALYNQKEVGQEFNKLIKRIDKKNARRV